MSQLAIITGTSSGLGLAAAKRFLQSGNWDVIGIARRPCPQELFKVDNHPSYHHLQTDLAHRQSLVACIEKQLAPLVSQRNWDNLCLINNAGVVDPIGPMTSLDFKEIAYAFDINLFGPVTLMTFVMQLTNFKQLRIINLSSGAAVNAYAGWSAYCSSKAALSMVSRCAAEEMQLQDQANNMKHISIIDYAPGVVDTNMQITVRTQDAAIFPMVQKFKDLHQNKALLAPELPAEDLFKIANAVTLPPYFQTRYPAF